MHREEYRVDFKLGGRGSTCKYGRCSRGGSKFEDETGSYGEMGKQEILDLSRMRAWKVLKRSV